MDRARWHEDDRDALSPLTGTPVVVLDVIRQAPPEIAPLAVLIGVDPSGACRTDGLDGFDVLLTGRADPPRPWVAARDPRAAAERLAERVRARPIAATVLVRLLRLQRQLDFDAAVEAESLAYSTLLGGGEFATWLAAQPGRESHAIPSDPLRIGREDDRLTMTLADPTNRNAISAAMRDALYDALANALDDPTSPAVDIVGEGRCFSVGGLLVEFGTARDLAQAHVVRVQRSCAVLLAGLGERARVTFHGACIGSGLEIFAAAARREARADAWFQLPELAMGLIPGAGGTATVARAIGRRRAAWLMLSGAHMDARQAKAWGLVHAVVP